GVGGTGGGGGSGGGGICTTTALGVTCMQVSLGDPTCDGCMQSQCCNQVNACFADQNCAGLVECLSANCAGASDVAACAQQYCASCEPGVTAFNQIASCLQAYCSTECG